MQVHTKVHKTSHYISINNIINGSSSTSSSTNNNNNSQYHIVHNKAITPIQTFNDHTNGAPHMFPLPSPTHQLVAILHSIQHFLNFLLYTPHLISIILTLNRHYSLNHPLVEIDSFLISRHCFQVDHFSLPYTRLPLHLVHHQYQRQ